MCVDGIGNAGYLVSLEQSARLRLRLQPAATSHKGDVLAVEHALLALPHLGGEVAGRASAGQILTVVTSRHKVSATQCDMANGSGGPDVVHSPHHGLATAQDAADAVERQHALVNPVQVNHIGLLKLAQTRDVGSRVGKVYVEEVLAREMQTDEDVEPLLEEMPVATGRLGKADHGQRVALLVANEHASLHAMVVQRHHQTVGSYRSTTRPLTCIYYQYSHCRKGTASFAKNKGK